MNFIPQIHQEFIDEYLSVLVLSIGSMINILISYNKDLAENTISKTILFSSLGFALFFCLHGSLGNLLEYSAFTSLIQCLLITTTLTLCFLASSSHLDLYIFKYDVVSLLLLSLVGMIVLATTDDLFTMFLGMELSLLALCALSGNIRPNRFNQEGALKFFILGSFASSIFIFGLAMVYASTGEIHLNTLIKSLNGTSQLVLWARMGLVAMIVGLAFILNLFPFQLWAADTYEASPTIISAYLFISFKVIIISKFIKIFGLGMSDLESPWLQIMMLLAGMSLIFGTLLSLVQTNIKRLLAYAGISQGGYLTMAAGALSTTRSHASESILFYLITYTVTSILAFGILMRLESEQKQNLCIDDLRGLAHTKPWYALGLTIALFSFAGIPPTAGFIAKFMLFSSALQNQQQVILVVLAAICNAIALFVYLRIVAYMYMQYEPNGKLLKSKLFLLPSMILVLASFATILLGTLLPGKTFEFIVPMLESKHSNP
ncbi:MAG: NADH-quinone oxidoreductase subunit N [Oligoflexales bacterium]